MSQSREELEARLNNLDPGIRHDALESLAQMAKDGRVELPEPKPIVNLHAHTFFSFNGYGYSPACFAWKARCQGLLMAGVVDFDVLDATDEFLSACRLLGLRGSAGIETRVFVPEFATREINSPGEPGINYYMGTGFASGRVTHPETLAMLKTTAGQRTQDIVSRINPFLAPVELDYEGDVLVLTPNGNATERHVCTAYETKAAEVFPDPRERAAFWADRLGQDPSFVIGLLDDSPKLQGLIRSRLMKSGGVGYVQPQGPDFPRLNEVSDLILGAGGIPALAWLDGLTEGEQAIDELLDLMVGAGVAAINIIPDRNWNYSDPAVRKQKGEKLHDIVDIAVSRGLPVFVGTEMNAHGQKFVDDFAVPEMAPLVPVFLDGAYLLHAHTSLQGTCGMGYLSEWTERQFASLADKNAFFVKLGQMLDPGDDNALAGVTSAMTPAEVLEAVRG